MATIHDTIVAALTKRGWTTIPSRTGKYTTLAHPGFSSSLMFVGKAGALRAGRNATQSRSLEDSPMRATLIREGEEILNGKPVNIPSI